MRKGTRRGATRFTLAEQRALLNQLRGGEGNRPVSERTFKRWRADAIRFGLVVTEGRTCKRPDRRRKPTKRGAYTHAVASVTYLEDYKRDKNKTGTFDPPDLNPRQTTCEVASNGTSKPSKMALSRPHTLRDPKHRDPDRESTDSTSYSVGNEQLSRPFPLDVIKTTEELESRSMDEGMQPKPHERVKRLCEVDAAKKRGLETDALLNALSAAINDGWCQSNGHDVVAHSCRCAERYLSYSKRARDELTADERIDRAWRQQRKRAEGEFRPSYYSEWRGPSWCVFCYESGEHWKGCPTIKKKKDGSASKEGGCPPSFTQEYS